MALKKLVSVGGGSAGWAPAAYLNAMLNGARAKMADITVVESAQIGRIGVHATVL